MSQPPTPPPASSAAEAASRPTLLRALGPGMAIAMVVGNVIGSGIFLKPGAIAASTGDFTLIILAWLVGGATCVLGALCLAELAVMLPQAGGLYVYLREAYGDLVAFLFGWMEFLFGRPASTGALAVAFVTTLADATGSSPGAVGMVAQTLLVIAAVSWINVLGVIWGGRFQALTTIIKAGFLGLVALLPFLMYFAGQPGFDPANYQTTVTPKETTTVAQFAVALLAVLWAYNGWHGVAPVAEEVRQPQRNIPLALFGGIAILIVLYLGANFAYHGVLSMEEMAGAGEHAAQAMIRKLLAPSGSRIADLGVAAMAAVIMCSTLGAINSNVLEGSRISFAMGRDNLFFRSLGLVHVNYRTPAMAIIVMGALSALLVVGTAILVRVEPSLREQKTVFGFLTEFVVFSGSLFYALAVFAVVVLRRRRPDLPRSYRTPGYPLVPIAYVAFYAWFLYYVYFDAFVLANIGLGLVVLGIPVYFAWQAWGAKAEPPTHDAAA